ncbi:MULTISPECIES: HPr kinase/phosphorylase [unclassified Brevundimonas]|uniref:HPr kinase/phosphorylase n=1 Tax=unclassified Brevundimonas TaxID=2622653 RepID=UPI0006D0E2CA|nr:MULTISPECIES: HPr kinase/phosphatase C-terminal domain-containing protein [unclassified Brevundimonas]ALJ07420.1 serine kinase [Brevundimonas sp. DS20]QFU30567.1 HPr kinase/phosphorylase [Brevundimonas sp. Bb-A]
MTGAAPIHATTVARRGPGEGVWRAVMILGPSGAGKSDLALRLIGRGWRLVSDDYTRVWASDGALYATAPQSIAGRIEARGVGIVSARTRWIARVVMAVACAPEAVERLPETQTRRFAGVDLPLLALDPRPPSAVEMVAVALGTL